MGLCPKREIHEHEVAHGHERDPEQQTAQLVIVCKEQQVWEQVVTQHDLGV